MTHEARTALGARIDVARLDDRFTPVETGELAALACVLDYGQLSGGALAVAEYEQALRDFFGATHAVAVNSGSSALHATLIACGAGPGTEVIVPAVAPLPTALPILSCGATPVIVDVLPRSLAIDPDDLQQVISTRTRAAISIPLWGYPVDTRPAQFVLAEAGIPLIEDAAQAHGTRINGRYAGTIGTIGCFSTHDRKLLSTGEGGFILTDNPELHKRIEHYTRLGHLRGTSHGVNYKLAAPLAAIGAHRLARLPDRLAAHAANARHILEALPPSGRLAELTYPAGDTPNYYQLVLTSTNASAADIADRLTAAGLPPDSVRYGYRPLYRQPIFAQYARACPQADTIATTTFQLPVHPGLTTARLEWVGRRVAVLAESESEQPS
jgi:perosamine synthetase